MPPILVFTVKMVRTNPLIVCVITYDTIYYSKIFFIKYQPLIIFSKPIFACAKIFQIPRAQEAKARAMSSGREAP